jgi:hypothetical protein
LAYDVVESPIESLSRFKKEYDDLVGDPTKMIAEWIARDMESICVDILISDTRTSIPIFVT